MSLRITKPPKRTLFDRDLVVDRTRSADIDPPTISYPQIRIGETVQIKITNYLPENTYKVRVNFGEVSLSGDTITYTAPLDLACTFTTEHGESPPPCNYLRLEIDTIVEPVPPMAIFNNGRYYLESGELKRAENAGGKYYVDYENITGEYPQAGLKHEVDIDFDFKEKLLAQFPPSKFPVPASKKPNTKEVALYENFSPDSLFGSGGSRKLSNELKELESNETVAGYLVASERNKKSDAEKFIYRKGTKKDHDGFLKEFFEFVPRNSNVTSSDGDVNTGYRSKGAAGGSLSITRGPDSFSRTDQFYIPVDLWELQAIVPDEIITLCLITLEIVPVLRGIPEGHTFEWEQIKGDQSTVVWITPKNQKDMIVDFGGIKVDRTFRFWVSRGTRYEKFYDVVIYGTPIDRITTINCRDMITTMGNHLNIKVHNTTPILLDHERVWHKQLRVNIHRNY